MLLTIRINKMTCNEIDSNVNFYIKYKILQFLILLITLFVISKKFILIVFLIANLLCPEILFYLFILIKII